MERQKMKNSISPLKVFSLHQSMFIVFNENIFSGISTNPYCTYKNIQFCGFYIFILKTLFLISIQCSILYFVTLDTLILVMNLTEL